MGHSSLNQQPWLLKLQWIGLKWGSRVDLEEITVGVSAFMTSAVRRKPMSKGICQSEWTAMWQWATLNRHFYRSHSKNSYALVQSLKQTCNTIAGGSRTGNHSISGMPNLSHYYSLMHGATALLWILNCWSIFSHGCSLTDLVSLHLFRDLGNMFFVLILSGIQYY